MERITSNQSKLPSAILRQRRRIIRIHNPRPRHPVNKILLTMNNDFIATASLA